MFFMKYLVVVVVADARHNNNSSIKIYLIYFLFDSNGTSFTYSNFSFSLWECEMLVGFFYGIKIHFARLILIPFSPIKVQFQLNLLRLRNCLLEEKSFVL